MEEAKRKLEAKGYYIANQFDGFTTLPDEFELINSNGDTVIDHLSEAQVIALAEML